MHARSFGRGIITIGVFGILFHSEAHGLPVDNDAILPMNHAGETGLLWASIALAVFTALLQGLVTTMALIAEDASMWTFRFRIARYEHWWWTVVSALLTISLILMTLSFLAGNNGEAVSILALSTATGLAIVRYAVPSWRSRHFIENRWLAWTGDSRTAIHVDKACLCGDSAQWDKLSRLFGASAKLVVPSDEWGWTWRSPGGRAADATAILDAASVTKDSKYTGSRYVQVYNDGLHDTSREDTGSQDTGGSKDTDTSGQDTGSHDTGGQITDIGGQDTGSHDTGRQDTGGRDTDTSGQDTDTGRQATGPRGKQVSLLWGSEQNFRKRVSRGIGSMPLNLLRSVPLTADNYVADGLCLAMGVLGRNKGLAPNTLVYGPKQRTAEEKKDKSLPPQISARKIQGALEATSTWKPRPSKVLRGYYYKTMNKQYGTISESYVLAAIELALIFCDCSSEAIRAWFEAKLEQQSWELNEDLQSLQSELGADGPQAEQMNALYRATYVSMILSLNYIRIPDRSPRTGSPAEHQRPDLHCMALLMMAEGKPKPRWWDNPKVAERLEKEENGLTSEGRLASTTANEGRLASTTAGGGDNNIAPWKQPMAWLLGLYDFPRSVESWDVGNAMQPANLS